MTRLQLIAFNKSYNTKATYFDGVKLFNKVKNCKIFCNRKHSFKYNRRYFEKFASHEKIFVMKTILLEEDIR